MRLTITSQAVIARLARTVNVLHADPGLVDYGCPAIAAEYLLTFVPKAAAQPPFVAVPTGCGVYMLVGRQQQPKLTGGEATITLMNRLLGLTRNGAAARH